jgi:hypothetical protein
MMQKQRTADIELLKQLKVKYICDLMVENRKVKYGLTVTSSEKADSLNRYARAGFQLVSTPYPGVEFFREYKDNKYCGTTAIFWLYLRRRWFDLDYVMFSLRLLVKVGISKALCLCCYL